MAPTSQTDEQHHRAGIVLDRGWRYDLQVWFIDRFVMHGRIRACAGRFWTQPSSRVARHSSTSAAAPAPWPWRPPAASRHEGASPGSTLPPAS